MSTEQNTGENVDRNSKQTEEASGGTEETDVPTSPSASKLKVDVLLKPAGDAPIMKKKKWAVERTKTVAYISDFIKRFIKMTPGESIFLYVNQSFAPAPDASVGTVFDCFGSDGKLVLHYCRTQAWG